MKEVGEIQLIPDVIQRNILRWVSHVMGMEKNRLPRMYHERIMEEEDTGIGGLME